MTLEAYRFVYVISFCVVRVFSRPIWTIWELASQRKKICWARYQICIDKNGGYVEGYDEVFNFYKNEVICLYIT